MNPMRPASGPASVRIEDAFWSPYQRLVREVALPYQWEALNDRVPGAEKSHAIQNLRIAAGQARGDFHGWVFQDSDPTKWLETLAYALDQGPLPGLEAAAEELIGLLEAAQAPDGYLNTYFSLKAPDKRWSNLREAHELYCAGHLIEAAVAYSQATGRRRVLDLACRFADLIDRTFGPTEGQLRGYCGHPEIELALVRLHEATGEERYLRLAAFFVDERGRQPSYFEAEGRRPGFWKVWTGIEDFDPRNYVCAGTVREQRDAEGHAVRLVYLYAAVADLARLSGDAGLRAACERVWESLSQRRAYVTGGIGSSSHGEAFTGDYDLPNDSAYAETCAAVGLVFFARRMLRLEADRRYGDLLETALYNGALSGMSLDGRRYFYVNPLELKPALRDANLGLRHVAARRQPWHSCACCPPNLARLIASLGGYLFTAEAGRLNVHLYVGCRGRLDLDGTALDLALETGYPYDGRVKLRLDPAAPLAFTLALRIPGWCRRWSCRVNGAVQEPAGLERGYLLLRRTWKAGDRVELELELAVETLRAHPKLDADAGKQALRRGPLVYCLEEADNGADLQNLWFDADAGWELLPGEGPLAGVPLLRGRGQRLEEGPDDATAGLYRADAPHYRSVPITAVPYALWGNREPGEMRVWIHAPGPGIR